MRSRLPSDATRGPAEGALLTSLAWLVGASALALPLLLLPQAAADERARWFIAHLAGLAVLGVLVTAALSSFDSNRWPFGFGSFGQQFAPVASLVAMVTFVVGLTTLATSAALSYEPSLQLLQLLSAMDIAWVVAASYLGMRRLFGGGAAAVGSSAMAIVCVWSIWRYLDVVGFTESGGWLVSGSDLLRLVIPFDIAAAVISIGLVIVAALKGSPALANQPTEQRRPQSYG